MNHPKFTCHPELIDPSGERVSKSEERGLTMLIDKGICLALFQEHLQFIGPFVDYVKLGFGTTVLYPPEVLQKKLLLAKKKNIILYPGGTLFEIASYKGVLKEYFDYLQKMGFDHIEISDGTIELPARRRQKMIKRAVSEGFTVITECGKKAIGSHFEVEELERTLYSDLECGAANVIVEGRESGKNVGIFNEQGLIDKQFLLDIQETIPTNMRKYLIWEAPQKNQQIELIHFWGRNVNVGNVQFEDACNLECLRRGLRFDTFPTDQPGSVMRVD
ncbi:phosphosulfolactate synthase [Fictibacillus sp. NRS-1165]|uniref:phosphosulfolactate synthase n=1 Tax=Fictibacillus sp. NRS-1165 TaxID=3144463 RepID=UPI003D1DDACC